MPSNKTPSVVSPGTGLPVASTAAASAIGEALKAHIDDPVGAHADSAISATPATSTWGPFALTSIDVGGQLGELLDGVNAPCHTIVVDGGNSPYTLDSNLASTYIPHVLVNTAAARTITLPQTPADHKGKFWFIRDAFGSAVTNPFTVQRWPASLYLVNGLSAASWQSFDGYTLWFVFCDGTDFFIHELPDYVGKYHYTVTSYALHPAGYALDQLGERDEKILVTTLLAPTASPVINLPDPSLLAGNAVREVILLDSTGYSELDNIILRVPVGVLLNGVSADYLLAKNWGQWRLMSNTTGWLVTEITTPRSVPYLHASGTPYLLDSRGANRYNDDIILVDTSAARTVTLPEFPARHNGQQWRVFDVVGTSAQFGVTFARYAGATYRINGNAGDLTINGNYSQWLVTCDGTDFYVQQLDTAVGPPVVVDGTNTPYTLDSSGYRDAHIYVDTTALGRAVVLPAVPALYEGRRWLIYDQDGFGGGNTVALTRSGVYSINGVAADTTLQGGYGQWVVVCDGHNFFVHPLRLDGQHAITSVTTATYTVDSNGYRDEILFVSTSVNSPLITLPNPTGAGQAGRILHFIDVSGNSQVNSISLQAPGPSVKINGIALVPLVLSANFGHWKAVCNTANWYVA